MRTSLWSLAFLCCLGGCTYIGEGKLTRALDQDDDGVPIGEDCDPSSDQRSVEHTVFIDEDGDGLGLAASFTVICGTPGEGWALQAGDECDGNANLIRPVLYLVDADGDGYGDPDRPEELCEENPPEGYARERDCDDSDATVHALLPWFVDSDGDGFGVSITAEHCSATPPAGFAANDLDCDDAAETVYPGAVEVCGGPDEDCDGLFDDDPDLGAVLGVWLPDVDLDGVGDATFVEGTLASRCPQPGDVLHSGAADCDDSDPHVAPGLPEFCDDVDNNCNGDADEGLSSPLYYADVDGDGFPDPTTPANRCDPEPPGWLLAELFSEPGVLESQTDCDDLNEHIHPGAPETYGDGLDQDCDGATEWDQDADGFFLDHPDAPAGIPDCDDQNAAINPAAVEIYHDQHDNDCDASTVDGDEDGDGRVKGPDDCDDENPWVYLGAPEVVDSIDNNCDPMGLTGVWCLADLDGDGFGVGSPTAHDVCDHHLQLAPDGPIDCVDSNAGIHPAVTEVCDGLDMNCDGDVDEGLVTFTGDDGSVVDLIPHLGSAVSLPPGTVDLCTDASGTNQLGFVLEEPGALRIRGLLPGASLRAPTGDSIVRVDSVLSRVTIENIDLHTSSNMPALWATDFASIEWDRGTARFSGSATFVEATGGARVGLRLVTAVRGFDEEVPLARVEGGTLSLASMEMAEWYGAVVEATEGAQVFVDQVDHTNTYPYVWGPLYDIRDGSTLLMTSSSFLDFVPFDSHPMLRLDGGHLISLGTEFRDFGDSIAVLTDQSTASFSQSVVDQSHLSEFGSPPLFDLSDSTLSVSTSTFHGLTAAVVFQASASTLTSTGNDFVSMEDFAVLTNGSAGSFIDTDLLWSNLPFDIDASTLQVTRGDYDDMIGFAKLRHGSDAVFTDTEVTAAYDTPFDVHLSSLEVNGGHLTSTDLLAEVDDGSATFSQFDMTCLDNSVDPTISGINGAEISFEGSLTGGCWISVTDTALTYTGTLAGVPGSPNRTRIQASGGSVNLENPRILNVDCDPAEPPCDSAPTTDVPLIEVDDTLVSIPYGGRFLNPAGPIFQDLGGSEVTSGVYPGMFNCGEVPFAEVYEDSPVFASSAVSTIETGSGVACLEPSGAVVGGTQQIFPGCDLTGPVSYTCVDHSCTCAPTTF